VRQCARIKEVHARRPDEARHEGVVGIVVEVHRRPHLLDPPGVQDDDPGVMKNNVSFLQVLSAAPAMARLDPVSALGAASA
jgi:hypothetical protein